MSTQKRHSKHCGGIFKPSPAPINNENSPPQSNTSKPISKCGLVRSTDVIHNGSPSPFKPLNVQRQQHRHEKHSQHQETKSSILGFVTIGESPQLDSRTSHSKAPKKNVISGCTAPNPSIKRSKALEPSDNPATAPEGVGRRQRKAVSMELKHNIAQSLKANPGASIADTCKEFGVGRGVVQKVAKKKEEHLSWSGKPDSFRRKKSRLPLVDILVAASFRDSQFCTSELRNREINTRATEIRSILSTLLLNPPCRCTFNATWIREFKKNRSQLETRCIHTSNHSWKSGGVSDGNWILSAILDQYELGDIYNVFLVGDFKATQKTSPEREIQEEVRVAAMLSYNGLGEKKDILFARINRDALAPATEDEIKYIHFDDTQGLDEVTFESWLFKFDAQVDHNVLVIIGPDTWKLLNINDNSKPLQKLRFVTVMNIGDTYHGILPEKCPEIQGLYPVTPLASGAEARISHDNILSSLSQQLQEIDIGFKSTSFLTLAGQSSCLRGQQCTCLSGKV